MYDSAGASIRRHPKVAIETKYGLRASSGFIASRTACEQKKIDTRI